MTKNIMKTNTMSRIVKTKTTETAVEKLAARSGDGYTEIAVDDWTHRMTMSAVTTMKTFGSKVR